MAWNAARPLTVASAALLGASVAACSSEPAVQASASPIDLLDPQGRPQGRSYAEWAGEWVEYTWKFAPPSCISPIADDTTGESCRNDQDPNSPVFFLTGTYGGPVIRDRCVVPPGKALFFPLLEINADNAGLAEHELLSAEEAAGYVESHFDRMHRESLHLEVDGQGVRGLERGAVRSAPYLLQLPAEPNSYTCLGITGVSGDFPGYVSGYWAMLAPLASGRHSIDFGGRADALGKGEITIRARYELTVE